MALNTNLTNTGGLASATAVFYDKVLLDRLEKKLHFVEMGQKKNLPKNSGTQVTFLRYSDLAAITSSLTEGTVPNGVALQSNQTNSTPLGYGTYIASSDRLNMEAIDNTIEESTDLLGYNAGLSMDTITRNALNGNVTNQFAGGAASEITTSAVLTADEFRKAVATLGNADAIPFSDGCLRAIISPASVYDIQSDTAVGGWLDVNKYGGPDNKVLAGEIGKLYNIRVVESSNIATGTGAASATTYDNYVFSANAFGCVNLANENARIIVKQLGSGGSSDPIDQIATVGWKAYYVTTVLDSNRAIQLFATTNL